MCKFCYTRTIYAHARHLLPAEAMGYRAKYWQNGRTFKIAMLDATRDRVDHVMMAAELWAMHGNFSFNYTQNWNSADMRIQLHPGMGSWSYVGTDNALIDKGAPTMNLAWIDESIRDGDLSTAMHEIGHFLGLGHEHQNPREPFDWDREAVIADLTGPPNSWSIDQIEHNVLRRIPLDEVDATSLDPDSIMMYFFPAHWLRSGTAQAANKSLSATDQEFIARIYPKPRSSIMSYIDEMLYNRRKVRKLDMHQLRVTLRALGYEPTLDQCRNDLRSEIYKILEI